MSYLFFGGGVSNPSKTSPSKAQEHSDLLWPVHGEAVQKPIKNKVLATERIAK